MFIGLLKISAHDSSDWLKLARYIFFESKEYRLLGPRWAESAVMSMADVPNDSPGGYARDLILHHLATPDLEFARDLVLTSARQALDNHLLDLDSFRQTVGLLDDLVCILNSEDAKGFEVEDGRLRWSA